jgi:hypothetical protein
MGVASSEPKSDKTAVVLPFAQENRIKGLHVSRGHLGRLSSP